MGNKINEDGLNLLPATDPKKYKGEDSDGLWVHRDAKFLKTGYIINNIQICPNREHMAFVLPAIDNSIVAHVENGYCCTKFIVHISAQGSKIGSFNPMGSFSLIGMLAPEIVLLVNSGYSDSEIIQWNLQTDEKMSIGCYQLLFNPTFNYYREELGTFLFPDSKILCYCCASNLKNKVKIFYYNYPLKSKQDKPCFTKQVQLTADYQNLRFVRLNNHSMVGWVPIKSSSDQFIKVVTHRIFQNEELIETFRIQLKIIQFTKDLEQSVLISDMWEVSRGVMFLQLSVVETGKYNQVTKVKKQSDFIWNYKQGNIRKAKFGVSYYHQVQVLGQFRRICRIPGYQEKVQPIYYVDMMNEQVMAIQKVTQQQRGRLCVYPVYSPQLQYCFILAREGYAESAKVTVRKFDWPKLQIDLAVAFLLENLITKCDDDLIYQAIRLIEGSES